MHIILQPSQAIFGNERSNEVEEMGYRGAWIWALQAFAVVLAAQAAGVENLVVDPSFEAPVATYFSQQGGTHYAAARTRVGTAADGDHVLAIQGWDLQGSSICGPPLELAAKVYSGTISVRSIGKGTTGTVELVLLSEDRQTRIAAFGRLPIDGSEEWQTIEKTGVVVTALDRRARLAIVIDGPHRGVHVEVDRVGLFAGPTLGTVAAPVCFQWFEGEALADGKGWQAKDHYDYWYSGFPNGGKMLSGSHGVSEANNPAVTQSVVVPTAGNYRCWIRFVTVNNAGNGGRFTVALRQDRKIVAETEIFDADFEKFPRVSWAWAAVEGRLKAGPAAIVLSRPIAGRSNVCRKVDLFLLTNLLSYQPAVQDLIPRGYLRFTNLSENQDPFCLWTSVYRTRMRRKVFLNLGMLSLAGDSRSTTGESQYVVPADPGKWLAAGDTSPWMNISHALSPKGDHGRNMVSMVATRKSHGAGFVKGRIKGVLEFAVGDDHRLVRRVPVDQLAPRIRMVLPADFANDADEIRMAHDFIADKEAFLAKLPPAPGPPATFLNLNTDLGFVVGEDDPVIIDRELAILKALGFNNTVYSLAAPDIANEFYRSRGLQTRFALRIKPWAAVPHGPTRNRDTMDLYHLDGPKLDEIVKDSATVNAAILPSITRIKLADEPSGVSYQSIVESPACREAFRAQLKRQGMTPADLGVDDWADVKPVGPHQRRRHPQLFYHTAIFRLGAFASFVRTVTGVIRNHFPKGSAYTYVNYSPPYSGGSWTGKGVDLFMAHRDGGLEMGFTEDWGGDGAGPQHLSDTLALLRAAGRHRQPLGSYCIPQGNRAMTRLKYYTLLAGGARTITSYAYGPWYIGIDSWGRDFLDHPSPFHVYEVLAGVQHEFGRIDKALAGTHRRPSDVAILYNRTQAIWADGNTTCEQNGWYTHWALAHAGYDADFIAEEDIEAGDLAKYKVLYIGGRQLRGRAAAAIATWVHAGGVLCGTAGAGTRDEYDHPMDSLVPVFAAASHGFELRANAGRPKYELRSLQTLDVLSSVKAHGRRRVTFDQLCIKETLEPLRGAKIILTNKDGRPTGTLHRFGRGIAIRLAAAPGITYLHEAVSHKSYDIESYLPTAFPGDLRDFIARPAKLGNAVRIAETSAPITEIVRYDGPRRAVVFVIDHEAAPKKNFVMKLADASQFTSAYTATGNPVRLKREAGGVLRITLPLHTADAIVLEEAAL